MKLDGQPLPSPQNVGERTFWLSFGCALCVHACLIFSAARSAPRYLGEDIGRRDAISVELVDPAALHGNATSPVSEPLARQAPRAAASPAPGEGGPPAPANPAPAPRAPLADAARPPAEAKTAAMVRTEPEVADASAPGAPSPPKEAKTAEGTPGLETEATGAPAALPSPPPPVSRGSSPQAPAEAPAKITGSNPRLSLNLDLPADFAAPSGLSTAAIRPPDITRSGENDEFGRRVIRALRQTMPPPSGELGRVTVRLLLSATGNLAEVRLVRTQAEPNLTQSVIFAVKQASFPIPPTGATLSDRTFLVTYIYN
jgi:hypothetical protein